MPTGKIFLTTQPALPAKCIVCNNSAKEAQEFVDFGTDFDYYGAVLFCNFCIVNAAELVGMVPVAKFEEADSNLNVTAQLLIGANRKIKVLESIVASFATDDNFSIDSYLSNSLDVPLEFEAPDDVDASSDTESIDSAESSEPATV